MLLAARAEKPAGLFGWAKPGKDKRVYVQWAAEVRRRDGAHHVTERVAEGEMTGEEALWWAEWFRNAGRVRDWPSRLGDTRCEPVARLWTPLAGARVEWFVWPDPIGGLVLMALFTPDEARPWDRRSVETSVGADDLASFGRSLEDEYRALVERAGL
jgi:hypothetical protein